MVFEIHRPQPIAYAAKQKSEDGVIALVERGADPNVKYRDGSTLLTWMTSDNFPARLAGARQVWASKASIKGNSLLMSIFTSSSSPSLPIPNLEASNGASNQQAKVHGSSPALLMSPPVSPGDRSPTSTAGVPAPMLGNKNGTMRRSTISIKATADKDMVMRAPEAQKSPSTALQATPTSTPAPLIGSTTTSRRGSVAYATIRARSTLSTAEGVALRNDVAAQVAQWSSRDNPSLSTSPRPTPDTELHQTGSTASETSASPDTTTNTGSQPFVEPKAGSSVSDAFIAAGKKEAKKDKKEKKEKKEKDKDKKEKEKEKKSKKSDASPANESSSAPTTDSKTKKEQKKEFRRKQAEDEAAKAEARAEKSKRRKTLNIFGGKKEGSPSSSSSKGGGVRPLAAIGRTNSTTPKDNGTSSLVPSGSSSSVSLSSSSSNSSSSPSASSPSPISETPIIKVTAPNPSDDSSSVPLSPNTLSSPHSRPVSTMLRSSSDQATSPRSPDQPQLVDTIPEGAVALPNGDFLVSVESDAVNLDALTDATCKVIREAVSPLLGTPNFEIKALLDATKILSTTIKSILGVSEVYALTLEDPEAGAVFTEITNALRTETARSLVLAIKSLTIKADDVDPLKKAMKDLAAHVGKLYKCLESVSPSAVVEMLQNVVVNLRTVVNEAKADSPARFQTSASQAVLITMRLCSLVQDFAFGSCVSVRSQRSLMDSAFALAQSVRGLIIAAQGVSNDPKSEQHNNGMAQMLKTAAEYVRAISRTIREEETFAANKKLGLENDHMLEPASHDIVSAYLRKGCGLMANSKDKYIAKSPGQSLASDERQILNTTVSQAQNVAAFMEALGPDETCKMMQTAVSIGSTMSTFQRLMQPLLDTTTDEALSEEMVVCLENVIRCGIQVKVLSSLIVSHSPNSEFKLQLGQTCQLWGVYQTLLLDATWRANHLL
jgi:hypothetical protein